MNSQHSPFGRHAFSVAEGMRAGLTPGVLRGPRFVRPYRGVRRAAEPAGSELDTFDVHAAAEEYAPRLTPGQFFRADTALALWGAPLPLGHRARPLHVGVWHPASPPRLPGIVGHRYRPRDDGGPFFHRLPLERPERAWAQVTGTWPADDLVGAADYLVSPRHALTSVEALAAELVRQRRSRHLVILDDVRAGSESPRETLLRLVLQRRGLPEPELNVDVFDSQDRFLARVDLFYRRWKVAVEFDGRQHAEDLSQFRRDAERWDDVRAAGIALVRVLDHQLANNGADAVRRVGRALRAAGWDPLG